MTNGQELWGDSAIFKANAFPWRDKGEARKTGINRWQYINKAPKINQYFIISLILIIFAS